ncbi:MAG: HD domain-containing phosphohydrolase [Vicinamibacterales bacterium]
MREAGTVVVADDVQTNLDLLVEPLRRDGYIVHTAFDGAEALALVLRESPDVVVTDVMMPKMTGFELCQQLKTHPATRLTPVVLVTSLDGDQDRLEGIEVGADDFLAKPVNVPELRARVRSLVRLKRFTDELDSAESVIISLARTVEARDPYTGGHCARMAAYASLFGTRLGLSDDEVSALGRGGYLHDVGKIAVPDVILLKAGRLTPEEFEVIKAHTTTGEALCGSLKLLKPVRPIVRSHHERFDGSGYPDGLVGDAIPLLAQLVGIVDSYDALTTERPYHAAVPLEAAVAELERAAAQGWYRRDLVREFAGLARSGQLAERARRRTDQLGLPAGT